MGFIDYLLFGTLLALMFTGLSLDLFGTEFVLGTVAGMVLVGGACIGGLAYHLTKRGRR